MNSKMWVFLIAAWLGTAPPGRAAELILPQNRNAFYSDEPIEIAIAGLNRGTTARVELIPQKAGLLPVKWNVKGEGSTAVVVLRPQALAPAAYTVRLDGKDTGKLTVASGVNVSTMLLSQASGDPRTGGGNFFLGNAFNFGLLDPQGQPLRAVRGRRSGGLEAFENAIRADLPTLVYMYWTGYVTHKPFGSEKSWPAPPMIEATRLLSFHTAQRLRRYARNIHSVGTLDEPGLSWGKTPAGGMASGFPNWDEQGWYAARGWHYTADPGARPAADWMKYLTIRCAIIKEVNGMARRDLKRVWPAVLFSTDLYAPHAIMDGTDPLNQQVNDVPSSHVFLDWGTGRLGALSGVYLEKAHAPTSKLAHAMNGQLFGVPVPQPAQRNTYHLMRNALLAAGLHSNWWLNPTAMTPQDLAAVNEPGLRLGPLFREMEPRDHDVAVLWSFTEIGRREQDISAREAKKKTGAQIKLLIASLPETTGLKGGAVPVNAYNVGGNYKEQVLAAHQALARAGYPAHILHERLLSGAVLKRYRALVIVGQTFELPATVKKAIAEFVAAGGKVVVDRTTTVKFPGAIVTRADLRDPGFRWGVLWEKASRKDHGFKSDRQASYYQTNYFMDEQVRTAVAPMKEAMQKTGARPALVSASPHLAAEKHTAGEGALYLVINAFEKLPPIPESQKYFIYNYAPYQATYTLKGIPRGSTVYRIQGADWKSVGKLLDRGDAESGTFAPGEMKLYLVTPRPSGGLAVATQLQDGAFTVTARLRKVKMPWPLTVTVTGPDGKDLYRVYRATDREGAYTETFPVGANAPPGPYTVDITSPVGNLKTQVKVLMKPRGVAPRTLADTVRVFDAPVIRKFLAGRPRVIIALGNEGQKEVARKLAADLAARGIPVVVKPEAEVLHKVRYPRVWNPYAKLYTAAGGEKKPVPREVKIQIKAGVNAGGKLTATTADGKDVAADWKQPSSRVTITGEGLVDFSGDRELCFEPGVQLYFNAQRQMTVLRGQEKEVQTTTAFRAKWAKPWARLTTHVGAYQLPPQLPEAYRADSHLILLGDSTSGTAVAALQASELLLQVADAKYPGPGKALLSFAWSPFGVEKNVILVGASDPAGLTAGAARLVALVPAGKD